MHLHPFLSRTVPSRSIRSITCRQASPILVMGVEQTGATAPLTSSAPLTRVSHYPLLLQVVGIEQATGSVPLHAYAFPRRAVLLLGNEQVRDLVCDCVRHCECMCKSVSVAKCNALFGKTS